MPRIPYPNVPSLPGVPQLLRQLPSGPPPILGTAVGIAQLVRSFMSKPVWGVFKHIEAVSDDTDQTGADLQTVTVVAKRKPVVVPDSIRDFGYQREWNVTSAPVQQGSFADYNRVAVPYEVRLRMTKGGSEKDRTTFLKQIDDLDSTQLYDIITPEKTYVNCNFLRCEVIREGEKGAFWLAGVDLYFREIRVVTSQYTKTTIAQPKLPSSANVQNNGTQQGQIAAGSPPVSVTQ